MGVKLNRVGEKGVSNEGYSMEIVAYRSAKDIDVLVDGKYLRECVRYSHFKDGRIHNPSIPYGGFRDRTGERGVSTQGYTLEIVDYRGARDMDVLVDGKYKVEGVRYDYFKEGKVMNPAYYADLYIGKEGISSEGYSMKILAYRGSNDIDVLIDDSVVVKNTTTTLFNRGAIANPNHYKDLYVGTKHTSNEGYAVEVVAYRNYNDIDVLVDNKYLLEGVRYGNVIRGKVVNPYHRSVHGVGYVGEGGHILCVGSKRTDCYSKWYYMLKRCYDPAFLKRHKSYVGCTVVEEWHNYQNFAEWYFKNTYTVEGETMSLDKDILVKGNKVYSPETCIITPQVLNTLILDGGKEKRGGYPIGVTKSSRGGKYIARMVCTLYPEPEDKRKYLGTYDTPEEAFLAYKTAKEAYIKQVADEYKDKIPKKLYDALYAYTIEITD